MEILTDKMEQITTSDDQIEWSEKTITMSDMEEQMYKGNLPTYLKLHTQIYRGQSPSENTNFVIGNTFEIVGIAKMQCVSAEYVKGSYPVDVATETINIPMEFPGRVKRIARSEFIMPRVGDLIKCFPKYARTGYEPSLAKDQLRLLAKGEVIELVRTESGKSGAKVLVCLRAGQEVRLPVNYRGDFEEIPEERTYTLTEIMSSNRCPMWISYRDRVMVRREMSSIYKDFKGDVKLNWSFEQTIVLYKKFDEDLELTESGQTRVLAIPLRTKDESVCFFSSGETLVGTIRKDMDIVKDTNRAILAVANFPLACKVKPFRKLSVPVLTIDPDFEHRLPESSPLRKLSQTIRDLPTDSVDMESRQVTDKMTFPPRKISAGTLSGTPSEFDQSHRSSCSSPVSRKLSPASSPKVSPKSSPKSSRKETKSDYSSEPDYKNLEKDSSSGMFGDFVEAPGFEKREDNNNDNRESTYETMQKDQYTYIVENEPQRSRSPSPHPRPPPPETQHGSSGLNLDERVPAPPASMVQNKPTGYLPMDNKSKGPKLPPRPVSPLQIVDHPPAPEPPIDDDDYSQLSPTALKLAPKVGHTLPVIRTRKPRPPIPPRPAKSVFEINTDEYEEITMGSSTLATPSDPTSTPVSRLPTSIKELPSDFSAFSVKELSHSLKLLKMDNFAACCEENMVDGKFFMELTEDELKSDPFCVGGFELRKLMRIKSGIFPKV